MSRPVLFYVVFFFLATQNIVAQALNKSACVPVADTNNKTRMKNDLKKGELNVLGTTLQIASTSPLTGFYRNGYCSTGEYDAGVHVIAAIVTEEFLAYSKSQGNDLITPKPQYNFAGLKPGDKWCLCANRWKEALNAGVAPPVILESTHQKALEFVTIEQLQLSKNVLK